MSKNFRVNFVESERDWGQSYETEHYETAQEAVDAYFRTNDSLPDRVNGFAPDYYFQAQSVEGFDDHTKKWYFIDPYKYRDTHGLTKTKESSKTVVETKPQETVMKVSQFSAEHLNWVGFMSEKIKKENKNGRTLLSDILQSCLTGWQAGLSGEVPSEWKALYQEEFDKVTDPDYATFLKLKEKFGE